MSEWTTPAVVRVALVHDARGGLDTWAALESLEEHPLAPTVRRWLASRVVVGRGRRHDHQNEPALWNRRSPNDGQILARELAIKVFQASRDELVQSGFFYQRCGHSIDEAYAVDDGETWAEVCDLCERAGLPVFP
jgi:hypothetical protein